MLRSTNARDEDFLWEMLFYASHSDEENGVEMDTISSNPDLTGYVTGWVEGGRLGVVAEWRSQRVGAAWLRALSAGDRANPVYVDEATLELAIAVLPELRGRGIGTTMMRWLLARVTSRVPAIVLSARLDNPAVRLYRRMGFETIGIVTNRVGTRSVKMLRRTGGSDGG